MRYPNRLPLLFVFQTAFALLCVATPSSAQNPYLSASAEAAAIVNLKSGDANRIMQALHALPYPYEDSLYKEKISYSVALALIEASERQTDLFFNSTEEYDEEERGHEFAAELTDYVVPLGIPEAIPALLKASQFGNAPAYALADFGPDIVYTIIEYIEDSQRTLNEISGAFLALQRTVETHRPLDPSIRSAAKEITVRYLQRAEEFYSGPDGSIAGINGAIYLAQAFGDPDLKQMVIDIVPFEEERDLRLNGMGSITARFILDNWDNFQQQKIHLND